MPVGFEFLLFFNITASAANVTAALIVATAAAHCGRQRAVAPIRLVVNKRGKGWGRQRQQRQPFHPHGSPGRIPLPVTRKSVWWRGRRIGTVVGIKSRTVRLPVRRSSGGRGRAIPQWRGWWQLPARWSSSICHSNEHYFARIIVLCNNQRKRKEVKWQRDSSLGGVSSTMVGVAATMQQST